MFESNYIKIKAIKPRFCALKSNSQSRKVLAPTVISCKAGYLKSSLAQLWRVI